MEKMRSGPYNVAFVLGLPGSGKGTQCQKVQETFGYHHISPGDLIREECKKADTELKEVIERHLQATLLIPATITVKLLRQEMERSGQKKFLIDGFPRNQENMDAWTKEMGDAAVIKKVICISCPPEVCLERCAARGRSDDTAETFKKRQQRFLEETGPVLDHFRTLELLSELDGGREPEQVFEDMSSIFADLG